MNSSFKDRLLNHAEHIEKIGHLCTTEETTKQALILPLLDILGFSAFDPEKVRAEYKADFAGCKVGERVDYALFCDGKAVMFIEAKSYTEQLDNHSPQLSRYFNATPNVAICAVTNGKEWCFFTDLTNKNIMDDEPFLRLDLSDINDSDIDQLYQFRHDHFQPDNLRTLAEESIYLSAFTEVITQSLQDVDMDFIRYVASRSNLNKQLNKKFLESIKPLVERAVQKSVSDMIITGLGNSKLIKTVEEPIKKEDEVDPKAPIIDENNSKIVTTWEERQIFKFVKQILGEESDIQAKDTESYYNVLAFGKTNRWVLRYYGDRKRPYAIFPIQLTDEDVVAIERCGLNHNGDNIELMQPEDIFRVSWLVREAYHFCEDDNNFKRKSKSD